MSKKWSSYEKDSKIMESWRRYVNNNDRWATYLNESRTTLTESEKNDLLQEIDFLKNLGARMRGAKQVRARPNLTHGWEAAVAEFAAEDENAKRLAKSVGFDNIGSEKEFLDKIRMTIAAAQKSGDPELGAAAEELAQDVEQAAAADDEGEASPTPVDVEEVPDAPAQGARDIKISASSRYGDATTLEDIAIQMLGLPGRPDPNKDRQQNRAVQQLTAKIMQALKKALQSEFGSSLGAVQTTYENNQAEIEKLFMEELHKSRK
jgi:hypothetical protein